MIKRSFYIVFLLALTWCFSNCDSSDSVNSFSTSVNGEAIGDGNIYVTKVEDDFVIRTSKIDELSFNKDGTFGKLKLDLETNNPTLTSLFYSYRDYSSHYMNFNLISVDEVHRRVKGSLSGYIFHTPLDLNSEQKFIEINFDYAYVDIIPTVKNQKNHCKINGTEWKRTNKYLTKGASGDNNNITQHDIDDGEYKMMVNYNLLGIHLGNFNYTPINISNNIQLAKYDLSTGTYINYNCSGSLNITQYESFYGNTTPGQFDFILSGTYSFTATNPNNSSDIIQVTDGDFKLLYRYF